MIARSIGSISADVHPSVVVIRAADFPAVDRNFVPDLDRIRLHATCGIRGRAYRVSPTWAA